MLAVRYPMILKTENVALAQEVTDVIITFSLVRIGRGSSSFYPFVWFMTSCSFSPEQRQSRDRDRHRADTVHSTTATSLQDNTNRPRDPPAISDRYNWLSSTIKVYTLQTDVALVVPEYLRVSSAVSKYKCRSGVATFTVDPDLIDHACGHTSL
ncbi:hypothetical protein CAPTEDRAFT_216888, partial [Capitella teleta]